MSHVDPLGAQDGEQALMVAAENNGAIDLLITDICMPKLSGIQLGIVFRVLWPHVKVLYMSGTPPPDMQLEPGCAFLPKPFTAQRLREAVQALTGALPLGVQAPAA
jgi:DNA-binding NtrC family response regulator